MRDQETGKKGFSNFTAREREEIRTDGAVRECIKSCSHFESDIRKATARPMMIARVQDEVADTSVWLRIRYNGPSQWEYLQHRGEGLT